MRDLPSWQIAIILFVVQMSLNWVRALNIKHFAARDLKKSLVSTNLLGAVYLMSTALGIHSLLNFDVLPLGAYFLGTTVGVVLAIRK